MDEEKLHYKMYKAGSKWMFAVITVVTLGIGIGQLGTEAKADTSTTTETTQQLAPAANTQSGAPQATSAAATNVNTTSTTTQTSDAATNDTTANSSTASQAPQEATSAATDTTTATPANAATAEATDQTDSNTTATTAQNSVNAANAATTNKTAVQTKTQVDPESVVNPTTTATVSTVPKGSTDSVTIATADNNGQVTGTRQILDTTEFNGLNYTLTVSNNDQKNSAWENTAFVLPYDVTTDQRYIVLDSSKTSFQDIINALPSGISVGFATVDGQYLPYDSNSSVTLEQVKGLQFTGNLAAGTTFTVSLPFKLNADYPLNSDPQALNALNVGIFAYTQAGGDLGTAVNIPSLYIATPISFDLTNDVKAVMSDGSLAPEAIQTLVHSIDPSQILVKNTVDSNYSNFDFNSNENASNTKIYTNALIAVPVKAVQAALVNSGYAALDDQLGTVDGQSAGMYIFLINDVPGQVTVASAIRTEDQNITGSVDEQFDPLAALDFAPSDATATVNDPNGVLNQLQNGTYVFKKAGDFSVTYSIPYDGSTIAKTVTFHLHSSFTKNTVHATRTISFVNTDGTINSNAPIVQTVSYDIVTDGLTGASVYVPLNGYDAVAVPAEAGYTAEITQVPAASASLTGQNLTYTVLYTKNATPNNGGSTGSSTDNNTTTGGTTNNGGSTNTNTNTSGGTTTDNSGDATTTNGGQSTGSTNANNGGGTTTTTNGGSAINVTNGQNGVTTSTSNATANVKAVSEASNNGTAVNGQKSTSQATKLPQTSDTQTATSSVIGLALLSALSVFGLARKSRKED
ncbi:KxYKxGKxW signal peptide domain-containing protein [Secundilactobacillus folii]|uniref:LPXTG cell wall anchor domain-containing protein n=1 Tax=Secundilactobacillus folii TaxID=2678357 RepID=A0A7X2XVD9_9LACO|nr:KxYKxGKxW signal peptide domain-containing protein [Secundilactobacillus folii]MTV81760.1 LPXTG cell wall anchor domain-containing protein [Secundilactobacillus folii]